MTGRAQFLAAALATGAVCISAPAWASGELQDQPTHESSDSESEGAPHPESEASAVARAAFTTGIAEREPVDEISKLTSDQDRIYFFTELVGLAGASVTHRWLFGGEVMAEVPFGVNGPRWRVYSSKQLLAGWTGTWTVSVVDDEGRELVRRNFDYLPAPTPAPASRARAE